MSHTWIVLSVIAPIGAVDVIYYHWHRFRLAQQPVSVAETLTHLLRHASVLVILALLATGVRSSRVDAVILALFMLDFLNSALDVALEPASRAPLGGLPPGEYLLHYLGTFGMGVAAATYWSERGARPFEAVDPWLAWPPLTIGGALFVAELGVLVSAHLRRARRAVDPSFAR